MAPKIILHSHHFREVLEVCAWRASISNSLTGPLLLTVSGAAGEKKLFAVCSGNFTYHGNVDGIALLHQTESAGTQVLVSSWFCLQRTWEKAWRDRNSRVRNQTVRFITECQRSFYSVTGNSDFSWRKKESCNFYVLKVPKILVVAMPQQKPDQLG